MVYSETTQIKIRTLIIAYLTFQENPCKGEDICAWINNHNFALNKVRVTPNNIHLLVREGYVSRNILRNVKILQKDDDILYVLKEESDE